MVRSVIAEWDDVFGNGWNFGGGVHEQQLEVTGWTTSECTSWSNCIQSDGTGYYILTNSENNGNSGHEFYVDSSQADGMTNQWSFGTGEGSMFTTFNWLATRGSSASGVAALSTPTG